MERRKFIIGMGALAAGSTAAIGSGAFSTASTGERTVGVNVADDSRAYLALSGYTENEDGNSSFSGEYAGNSVFAVGEEAVNFTFGDFDGGENTLELNFGQDNAYQAWGGEGVNPGSTYEFDDVFQIANLGHELGPVDVWIERSEGLREGTEVTFYATGGNSSYSGSFVGEDNSQSLNNTEWVDVGVEIEANDDVGEFDGSITVHAERQ